MDALPSLLVGRVDASQLVCVADLRTFGGVVLFAGSVVWFRLGSWVRVLLAAVLCCRYIFLACVCVSSVFLYF